MKAVMGKACFFKKGGKLLVLVRTKEVSESFSFPLLDGIDILICLGMNCQGAGRNGISESPVRIFCGIVFKHLKTPSEDWQCNPKWNYTLLNPLQSMGSDGWNSI